MVVRKKTKVFFLTPTKKIKLRMACGLEKDVPGSEKEKPLILFSLYLQSGVGPTGGCNPDILAHLAGTLSQLQGVLGGHG